MAANLKDLPRHYYTIEEYFAIERAGKARYEYWDGEIVCMSGGTPQHSTISSNIHFRLRQQLAGGNCRAWTSDMAVNTPLLPPYRYPDVSVACGRPVFETVEGIGVLTNPVLLVEVLSPGTAGRDRNEKRTAYQALPTLQEYLLVSQDTPHITHYVRQGEEWVRTDHADLAAAILLPSLGIELALGDIYEGVEYN
jgi:Uma2 family endonuclease